MHVIAVDNVCACASMCRLLTLRYCLVIVVVSSFQKVSTLYCSCFLLQVSIFYTDAFFFMLKTFWQKLLFSDFKKKIENPNFLQIRCFV